MSLFFNNDKGPPYSTILRQLMTIVDLFVDVPLNTHAFIRLFCIMFILLSDFYCQ